MTKNLYALYKGDEFIDLGTQQYLADKLGIAKKSLASYMTPMYQRRNNYKGWVLIRIKDDLESEVN